MRLRMDAPILIFLTMIALCPVLLAQNQLQRDLIFAAYKGNTAVILDLLAKGADVNGRNQHGRTALTFAAEYGHTKTLQALLAKGADVNAKDSSGRTALIYAAEKGDTEAVQALMAKGADVNAMEKEGRTALKFAEAKGHTAIVRLLGGGGLSEIRLTTADGQSEFYVAGDEKGLKGREFAEYKLTSFQSKHSQPGMLFYDFSANGPNGSKLDGMFGFNIKGDFAWVAGGTVVLSGKGTFGYGHIVNGVLSGSGARLAGKSNPVPILAIEWNGHDLPPKRIWVEGNPPMLFLSQLDSVPK